MVRESSFPCKWLKGGDLRTLEKEMKPQHMTQPCIEQYLPRNHNVNVDCFQLLKSTHRHSTGGSVMVIKPYTTAGTHVSIINAGDAEGNIKT